MGCRYALFAQWGGNAQEGLALGLAICNYKGNLFVLGWGLFLHGIRPSLNWMVSLEVVYWLSCAIHAEIVMRIPALFCALLASVFPNAISSGILEQLHSQQEW